MLRCISSPAALPQVAIEALLPELAVTERQNVDDRLKRGIPTCGAETIRPESVAGAGIPLLELAERFDALVAELVAAQSLSERPVFDFRHGLKSATETKEDRDIANSQIEAVLAPLYSIELAILETPACTIADLGVKAHHAAYVMSQYWETPISRLDWDARTIRLLIEAVCKITGTPILFKEPRDNG
jgi:hypothetical protein